MPPSGIQTRDPTNREAADLRLRPHGHRDLRIRSKSRNGSKLYLLVPVVHVASLLGEGHTEVDQFLNLVR